MRQRVSTISNRIALLLAASGVLLLSAGQPTWAKVTDSKPIAVPKPQPVQSRSAPLKQGKTALVRFQTAPFPYRGSTPSSGQPFFDVH